MFFRNINNILELLCLPFTVSYNSSGTYRIINAGHKTNGIDIG